ncbi:NAD(P)-dependent oxidoreductase [Ruminococcus sp. OA3]|uniref:NAD-dependent epimerase/dehydratase family protein n=1 Tax=Ruminococcus sp. OA3 TaxID=2914164 RepID=UPI001F06B2BF|nr:NAD(P)-dependent oxidoreductase [Ruminococcus sp. OA3]MCH1981363.1 NAD(P)-dependent oxidoreductase [Ruminococcus sp. OA3]
MKRIVVTGATSMIGAALIEVCLAHGIEVYAVVRVGSGKLWRLPCHEKLHVVPCELADMECLPGLIGQECDTFYHIAWGHTGAARNQSVRLQSDNIGYTLDAAEAAKELGCRRFIGAGSQAEYGVLDLTAIGPDAPENPRTPYGISKLAAGKLAFACAKELGLECIWPRIFSVYGIYDKESSMISEGLRKMLNGEATEFTKAEQRWDYLYSRDAGNAFYLIGEKGRDQAVYCVGSGRARRLSEYIYAMRDAVDPGIIPGIGRRKYPEGAVMNLCADIRTLTEDTGFMPEYSFEKGIRETAEWLRRISSCKRKYQ